MLWLQAASLIIILLSTRVLSHHVYFSVVTVVVMCILVFNGWPFLSYGYVACTAITCSSLVNLWLALSSWAYSVLVYPLPQSLLHIHTLRVHYAHAVANLNSGYSKYAKVARVHYFCTIALWTSHAVLTRAWASRRVDLRERRIDLFSKRVITFCWWYLNDF